MRNFLHDALAQAVDYTSFGFINALHMRGKAGSHSRDELLEYLDSWKDKSVDDYFAIPENAGELNFSQSGSYDFTSPLPSDHAENNRVHMDVWLGPKGIQSPTMFLLHGLMSVSDVGYRYWAKRLNELGWSAIFVHLPYHYRRRPAGTMSGEIAISSNLIRVSEGLRQSVIELRWLCRELKRQGSPHAGLWGTSYGGWVTSLAISIENFIKTAWLIEPICNVDHVIWRCPASIALRAQIKRRQISALDTSIHYPKVSPFHQQSLLDPKNIILVGGTFDRVAPIEDIYKLHQQWTGSHFIEMRQGHVGYQMMPACLKLAQEKLSHLFAS